MRFAVAALIGAVSASNLQSMMSWKVQHSQECINDFTNVGTEISTAFSAMPSDVESQIAFGKTGQFFVAMGEICTHNGDLLVCDDAREQEFETKMNDAIVSLNQCGTTECFNLAQATTHYLEVMEKCTTEVPKTFKQMIRITVPVAK